MYERSLSEAEVILSSKKDSLLPVSKVWEEVVKRSKIHGFVVASLPDFSALLEGDRRFKIIPAQVKGGGEETLIETDLADEEMESLGFYSEDRVKLSASRVLEPEISEEEEEIGSIRRRAFVNQAGQSTIVLKKNSSAASKETHKKPAKEIKSSAKVKSSKLHKKTKPREKEVRHRKKK